MERTNDAKVQPQRKLKPGEYYVVENCMPGNGKSLADEIRAMMNKEASNAS